MEQTEPNEFALRPELAFRTSSAKLTIPDDTTELRDSLSTPRSRGRSRTFSQLALPFVSPTSEKSTSAEHVFSSSLARPQPKPNKALIETRNLLAHILNELVNRPRAPSIWNAFRDTVKGRGSRGLGISIISPKKGSPAPGKETATRSPSFAGGESDNEDGFGPADFSPDSTFDLLGQLKDVLLISKLQGWQLFDVSAERDEAFGMSEYSEKSSSFRFRRSSFQGSGRRSRSYSPGRKKKATSELLALCISTLGTIVQEDCRFQLNSTRLTRPPNALQALTLDVSLILIYLHRNNARILYEIGLAIIPAFTSFPRAMHWRLLSFFESGLLRTMLEGLRKFQRRDAAVPAASDDHELSISQSQPIVAIQLDEVKDENTSAVPENSWPHWVTPGSQNSGGVVSSDAPAQALDIYYLSSVVVPLLTTILDSVDLTTQDLVLSDRIDRVLRLIADCKIDMPLNLLEIMAYHSSTARYFAICLLQTYWPKAFGHLSVSRSLPILAYSETLSRSGLQRPRRGPFHPYSHQFVPWHFAPSPSSILFEGSSLHDCHSCQKQINDFGLFCPLCLCAIHSNCYDSPDGCFLSHYPVPNDPNTQKVAVHRFSYVRSDRLGKEAEIVRVNQHSFILANIFTLSLCGICYLPLWGYSAQGYRCTSCNRFAHPSCLQDDTHYKLPHCSKESDTTDITIDWAILRSSFADHYREMLFREEDIIKHTHEEISVYWSCLWTQLQLLKYGIASGSIIVSQVRPLTTGAKGGGVDDFELQYLVKLYEAYLASGRLNSSPVYQDWLQRNGHPATFRNFMFDWSTLLFVTSIVKSPADEEESNNDLLNVTRLGPGEVLDELTMHPFESASVAHIRDTLGREFGLFHDQAACIMISHLRHVGFLDSTGLPEGSFASCNSPNDIDCQFPIPLGLDLSTSVESLIVAVETCLRDLDISVNEAGFLLLTRKMWPNGMASDYALTRLANAVFDWILSEDDNLVIILREYVAKRKNLPGVPSSTDMPSWPTPMSSRTVSSGSVNNGNDYVACRKALLSKYANRWLFALHCQDPNAYASLIFEVVTELARTGGNFNKSFGSEDDSIADEDEISQWVDKSLRSIIKISQSGSTFSVSDDLLLKWLDFLPGRLSWRKPLPMLPRLFNREVEGSARWTAAFDATIASFEHVAGPLLDPWRIVTNVASQDYDGLKKGLKWLGVFASSGVDIPISTFLQVSALLRDFDASFDIYIMLVEAVFISTWIRSLGRLTLQRMISDVHDRNSPYIIDRICIGNEDDQVHRFLRLTLATCLLLHGCERASLQSSGLIVDKDIDGLPSRRRALKRASLADDHSVLDFDFIGILSHYVEEGTDEVRCLVAKFFAIFITETSLLSSQEIEEFILTNIFSLTHCAWRFYDMRASEISEVRTTLLLRILASESQPFGALLEEKLHPDTPWETRFCAATQLFRIILDVTKPSFTVEGRQWRSSVLEVFYGFFSCMWTDTQEEIRLAVDTWSQTLQPAHFQAITLCFNESLSRAPIADRLRLVTFLLQLRTHFTAWKVLSWDVIVETLMDDDFMQRNNAEEGPASAHLSMYGISSHSNALTAENPDTDVAVLQCSLILLSLEMIADGVSIDVFSLLKVKFHLVMILGFSGATLVPAPSGHSFHVHYGDMKTISTHAMPCITGLMTLLDAYRPFDISPSAMTGAEDDVPMTLLVGSVFVDVFLSLFNEGENLTSLPFVYSKALLQTLIIVIYKHDMDSSPLRHLREQLRRAVRRASDLLLLVISHELRLLALSVNHAYLKRWPSHTYGVLVYQTLNVMKLVSALQIASDDALVHQAMTFLEDDLLHYWPNGLFYQISKRTVEPETFSVIRHIMARNARSHHGQGPLRDAVLRDTLNHLVAHPNDPQQKTALENLQFYIEIVHHQSYPLDLLLSFGRAMIAILRNAGELSPDGIDPNTLLLSAALLVQHNKAQIRDFLPLLDNALRIALGRFDVGVQALSRLLHVTSTLYRRSESNDRAWQQNIVTVVIVDVLSEALRGKNRATSFTVAAMVQSLSAKTATGDDLAFLSNETMLRLSTDAVYFLQNFTPSEDRHSEDLNASKAAASLILWAVSYDVGFLSRQLNDNSFEKKNVLTVRAWNILVLDAVQSSSVKAATHLFTHVSRFSFAYHVSLRMHLQSLGLPPDLTSSDINQAFIAIKLWLLLARKRSDFPSEIESFTAPDDRGFDDRNALLVWNDLWPPFERLIALSEADAASPIATLIWSSVADIFLFLRQMRSTISLDSSSHIATLNRLKALGKGESFTNKFVRTVNSMSEPPQEIAVEDLIAQVNQELLAAERLHALGLKREFGRALPRKDVRVPTG